MKKKILTLTCTAALCFGGFVGTASADTFLFSDYTTLAEIEQAANIEFLGDHWVFSETAGLAINAGTILGETLPAIQFGDPIDSLTLGVFSMFSCCAELTSNDMLKANYPHLAAVSSSTSLNFEADNGTSFDKITWTLGNDDGEITVNLTSLDFTPTPIPGALILLGSGLMGLMGIRRRFIG